MGGSRRRPPHYRARLWHDFQRNRLRLFKLQRTHFNLGLARYLHSPLTANGPWSLIFLGLEGHKQPKVPTIISYDPSNRDSFTWGAQRHKHTKIEGIKLLLDPDQETPIYLPQTNTAQELRKLNQPVVGVVGDYLASIYSYALGKIKSKVPADYFHMCQKIYVVSVPAVWSDKAKNITLRVSHSCANEHGLTALVLTRFRLPSELVYTPST